MRRVAIQPRQDWKKAVEADGLLFHSPEGEPYWDESACYVFTSAEIDAIEKATYELDRMCLATVQRVIDEKLFDRLHIPPQYGPWITQSWERDEQTVVGRFDLCFDARGVPQLLEYNADTPTSLLEAAVIQWRWMKSVRPEADQFNSIHERLIEAWQAVAPTVRGPAYFAATMDNLEDFITITYLRDTAMQAGLTTAAIDMEAVGWNFARGAFVDGAEREITDCFKLYPWEWMLAESFGANLPRSRTRWLEAPWKMILSNKAILPALWEMFPQSPYLLAAGVSAPTHGDYVRKPVFGREGANVTLVIGGQAKVQTGGDYGEPFIYQQYRQLPQFDGRHPVIGSWMVNGYACGIGIREDESPVTGNRSRFVPHVIEG